MGFNLIEKISRTLTDNLVGQIGGLLGESERRTRLGIAAGVPALLEGVIRSSATDAGMRNLERTLDEQEPSISDDFGQQLMFDKSRNLREMGGRLTRNLLGADQRVSNAVSHVSGMGATSSAGLVSMLLPLIVGQLGKHRASKKLDTPALRSFLSQQLDFAKTSQLPEMRGLFDGQFENRDTTDLTAGRIAGAVAATTGVVAASQLSPAFDGEKVPTGYTRRPSDPDVAGYQHSHGELHAVANGKSHGQDRNGTRIGGFVDLAEAADGELIDYVYRYFDIGDHISNHQVVRRLGLSEQRAEELRDTLRRRGAMNPTSGRLVARSAWDAAYRNPASSPQSFKERREAERRSMDVESSHSKAEAATVARGALHGGTHSHANVRAESSSWWPLIFLAAMLGGGVWLFSKYLVPNLQKGRTSHAIQAGMNDRDDRLSAANDLTLDHKPGDSRVENDSANLQVAGSLKASSEFELSSDLSADRSVARLFGEVKETLSRVVDVNSANSALPQLDACIDRMNDISREAPGWSSAVMVQMARNANELMPTMDDSVERVLGIASLQPVMEQPLMRLIEAVDSLILTK